MPGKYKKTSIVRRDGVAIEVYATPKIADALVMINRDMTLYQGVKFTQLLEAVYDQGKKDGRRDVFENIASIERKLPHRLPGRPRTRKKR